MDIKSIIYTVKLYYRVGRLLHLIAFISLITFIFSLNVTLYYFEKDRIVISILYGYLAYLCFGIFLFAELDGRSRYQNFKQLRDQLYKYGYQQRILRPMLNSRCQRDAAIVACEYFGFGQLAREHFYNQGYRWYHIIPDFVFSDPKFLITLNFWNTTFFVPRYKSEGIFD